MTRAFQHHPAAAAMAWAALHVAGLAGAAPQASAQDAPPGRVQTMHYALDLPDGWRRITPDQCRTLRWPPDVERLVNPGLVDRFGAVDRWLADGFDGTCLTVFVQTDGEPPMTEETLRRIRAKFAATSAGSGLKVEGTPRLATLGADRHPVIECELAVASGDGELLARKLVFIVPTGGRTIWFHFRAAPDRFAGVEPLFRRTAATITVPAPPQGPVELEDKLKTPLLVGGLIGLIMLVLYKMNRS